VAKAPTKKPSASKSGARPAAKPAKAVGNSSMKFSVKKGTTKAAAAAALKPSAKAAAPVAKSTTKDRARAAVAAKPAPKVELKPMKPAAKSLAAKSAVAKSAVAKSVDKADKSMKKSKDAERKGISIPAPVPTDLKPAKNQIGLRSAELEHFRDLLLAKRRELVGDMSSMEREALQRGGSSNLSNLPLHMADQGTDNYEQEFTLGLMEKDRNLLREINNALAKIQDGSYGICEGTGLPISKPRLEAQPWAKYSIEHARMMERTGMGIRRV
jgi:DnaK suppressor protein